MSSKEGGEVELLRGLEICLRDLNRPDIVDDPQRRATTVNEGLRIVSELTRATAQPAQVAEPRKHTWACRNNLHGPVTDAGSCDNCWCHLGEHPKELLQVIKITTFGKREYFTDREDRALFDGWEWQKIERISMSAKQYSAIPATADAALFFGLNQRSGK